MHKWTRALASLLSGVGLLACVDVGFEASRTWSSGLNQENAGVGLIAMVMSASAVLGVVGAAYAGKTAWSPPRRWPAALGALVLICLLELPCLLVGWLCLSLRT